MPTYIWTPGVKNEMRYEKPAAHMLTIIDIDSSPEQVTVVRKALRKLRVKTTEDKKREDDPVIKTTAEKAIARLTKIRPWKDAEGAKHRKKERRRVMLAVKRKRKNAAAKSKWSRKMVSAAKTTQPGTTDTEDALLNSLIEHVIHSLRGKRVYARTFVDYIARVGTTPSAGGARGPIALILSQVGGYLSAQALR